MVKKNRLSGDWAVYIDSSLGVLNLPWHRVTARFDTWREAMDYADRRARTVEVVLPVPEVNPPVDVHSPAWHVSESLTRPWVATIGRYVSVSDRHGWGDHLDADTAEKLGLALLAAAKHAKGELLADQEES